MVKMMNSCTAVPRQNDQSHCPGKTMQFAPTPAAGRTHAHKEFSCCCCCAVSWTTFLGLQFQMDCVGWVIALS